MDNLLSKLSTQSANKPIEPRKIFMSLPNKRYDYPRDVQTDVWEKWFPLREQKNTIVKMNTGSGKTIVGLMILQSCLNEKKGPAVYVVPDNYLVAQVCAEAKVLGIKAVTDRDDYDYSEGKAILVVNVHELINGKSVFGMRPSGRNYQIGCVLLDDVHACLDTISTQFSIRVSVEHKLYEELVNLIAEPWRAHSPKDFADIIEMKDPTKNTVIPYWIWQEKSNDIYKLLKQYERANDETIIFNLPLIQDILGHSSCVVAASEIEITPKGIPISKITSFNNASRRIFMSATLADDSVFVSALGLKPEDIVGITPNMANDIGDRLILFPRHLNGQITDDDLRQKIAELAKEYNIAVIVPSFEQAKLWEPHTKHIAKKDSIEAYVDALKNKSKHLGIVVFVNRYDGIDLPDDACRMLVIDGLPPLRSKYDKYAYSINTTNKLLLREQMQKIEQGMGRGVRSTNDSCCIILMGDKLADILIRNNGVEYFSNATIAQYDLSKELWGILRDEKPKPTVDDIFELASYSLERTEAWIEQSKQRLSTVAYRSDLNIDKVALALRNAFELVSGDDIEGAVKVLDEAVNSEEDTKARGFLLSIKAEYVNLIDRNKSQQILRSARKLNQGVIVPIAGIQYEKNINNKAQARLIQEYLDSVDDDPNNCVIRIHAVLNDLVFSSELEADTFEQAFEEVGAMLGFKSSRPEKEGTGGPDNLWAVGNNEYFVVECKSGAKASVISKGYCNQLNGSVQWFKKEYGNECKLHPVIIHPANAISKDASPPSGMKVITPVQLDKLKKNIKSFFAALVQSHNWKNEEQLNALLVNYKLRSSDMVQNYMSNFTK